MATQNGHGSGLRRKCRRCATARLTPAHAQACHASPRRASRRHRRRAAAAARRWRAHPASARRSKFAVMGPSVQASAPAPPARPSPRPSTPRAGPSQRWSSMPCARRSERPCRLRRSSPLRQSEDVRAQDQRQQAQHEIQVGGSPRPTCHGPGERTAGSATRGPASGCATCIWAPRLSACNIGARMRRRQMPAHVLRPSPTETISDGMCWIRARVACVTGSENQKGSG